MRKRLHALTQAGIIRPPRPASDSHAAMADGFTRPPSLIPWASMRCATASRLAAGVTTSSQKVLQRHVIQHGIRQQPLQPRVLILQCLQPLGLRDFHPVKLGFPFVSAGAADAVLAAQIGDRTPASCSFNIPMICSSEKRFRFMLWSFICDVLPVN